MRSLILFLYEHAETAFLWALAALALVLLAWLAGMAVLLLRKKGRRLRWTAWCLGAALVLGGALALFLATDALYEGWEARLLAGLDGRVRSCSFIPVDIATTDVDLDFFTIALADEPGFGFEPASPELLAELGDGGPEEGQSVYVLSRSVDRLFGGPQEFVAGGWLLYVQDRWSAAEGFRIDKAVRFTAAGNLPDCPSCGTVYLSLRTY